VNQRRLDSEVVDIMGRLSVKAPGSRTFAMQLSGGNQQKVVVAKCWRPMPGHDLR